MAPCRAKEILQGAFAFPIRHPGGDDVGVQRLRVRVFHQPLQTLPVLIARVRHPLRVILLRKFPRGNKLFIGVILLFLFFHCCVPGGEIGGVVVLELCGTLEGGGSSPLRPHLRALHTQRLRPRHHRGDEHEGFFDFVVRTKEDPRRALRLVGVILEDGDDDVVFEHFHAKFIRGLIVVDHHTRDVGGHIAGNRRRGWRVVDTRAVNLVVVA
ncbi:unnamed protein product [Phytomonas sp. EM1]|nr:unnamed protein product [Phytomonas sp. EM1]|eukprot:CCW63647.1 unnamed protein product [Phytomonas sp. isolate EM1]